LASFRYNARKSDGLTVDGIIEATDRGEALSALSERGLFASRLELFLEERRTGEDSSASSVPVRHPIPTGRIRRKEITTFTRQMAALLEATIPIPAALGGLGEEEENGSLRQVLGELSSSVRRGESFSEALQRYPHLFPPLYVSMVEVGEEAGALDKVMSDLADLLEQEDEVRSEVLGAVAYPCFVLAFGMLTTFILLVFIMPSLFGMLEGMLAVLPAPTRILLAVSEFSQKYWLGIVAAVAGGGLLVRWYLLTPRGAFAWDRFRLHLPLLGRVFRAASLGRFARTLGTLVRSGVSLIPALQIVENTVGNRYIAQSIARVTEETRSGDSLAAPLRRLGLFPAPMVQMISVGEETGRLDTMLLRVAGLQERQMRRLSSTLISLLGPALILVVGAIIGFVVISLLLPIFQMSQAFR